MKRRLWSVTGIVFAGVLVASCAKTDVQSACYRNADHEKLSDGRITKICSCVASKVQAAKLTERETGWVISMLENNPAEGVKGKELGRLKEVAALLGSIKRGCESEAAGK